MPRASTTRPASPGRAAGAAAVAFATFGVVGCGRSPEPSRFVPADPAIPGQAAAVGDADRARPEVRKIEMH